MRFPFKHMILALPLLTVIGCAPDDDLRLDGFGLLAINLDLSSEALGTLASTSWGGVDVPGEFRVGAVRLATQVSYGGASTIDTYKKNIDVRFSGGEEWRGRRRWRLSAQTMDPTMLRGSTGFAAMREAGLTVPEVEPVVVYLNRELLGLYLLTERIDPDFFAVRGLDARSIYKAQLGNATFGTARLPDLERGFSIRSKPESYVDLKNFIDQLASPELDRDPEKFFELVDESSLWTYMAASTLLDNWDGWRNNFHIFNRTENQRFVWVPWDLDRTLENYRLKEFKPGMTIYGENAVTDFIKRHPALRRRYLARLSELASGVFAPEAHTDRIRTLADRVAASWEKDRVLARDGRVYAAVVDDLLTTTSEWHALVRADLAREQERSP